MFALVGTSLISGALALFYDLLGQRIKSQSISVDGDANHRKILGGLITLSTDYIKVRLSPNNLERPPLISRDV